MSQTSYSKLSQRDIDRAETDLLIMGNFNKYASVAS